jgi:hypothetical protein
MAYALAMAALVIAAVALVFFGQFVPKWARRRRWGHELTGIVMAGFGLGLVLISRLANPISPGHHIGRERSPVEGPTGHVDHWERKIRL